MAFYWFIGDVVMQADEDFLYDLTTYDYGLPEELIAQVPAEFREKSRLLVLDRRTGKTAHRHFEEITTFLLPGDLLVVNNTRVVPARLKAFKATGGRVEILVLDPYKSEEDALRQGHMCLVRSSKPVQGGMILHLEDGTQAMVRKVEGNGRIMLQFPPEKPLLELLESCGEVPLPPYIQRNDSVQQVNDHLSYQTVYACRPGAVAAPTAGLHFSSSLLQRLSAMGVETAAVTLHVGYGTFSPIRTRDFRQHTMHSEHVEVTGETAQLIKAAKDSGRRVIAVGTTVVRTLEWVASMGADCRAFSGPCDHYIYPGYVFKVVDAMITNFHLPKSSLLLLVSAFAGREKILNAYEKAVSHRYRFFSYGDAMFIV